MKAKGTVSGPQILVVDDEPAVLHALELVLGHAGYRCVGCESGGRALQILDGPTPLDAALVDLVLPDIPGEQVLAAVRRLRPGLPLIAISGFGGETVERRQDLEVDAFLAKPFAPSALTALIREHLGCRQT